MRFYSIKGLIFKGYILISPFFSYSLDFLFSFFFFLFFFQGEVLLCSIIFYLVGFSSWGNWASFKKGGYLSCKERVCALKGGIYKERVYASGSFQRKGGKERVCMRYYQDYEMRDLIYRVDR